VKLDNCFKTSHLIIPFHPFQDVREFDQSFKYYPSSDHPIPSSSSVSRKYVISVNYYKSHLIILYYYTILSSLRMYVNLPVVNCFKTSHLIITFHLLQNVSEIGQLSEYLSSDHHIPSFFICLQSVRDLGQLFEYSPSDHPIPSSSSVSRNRKYVIFGHLF
jgi:hypothetical protein